MTQRLAEKLAGKKKKEVAENASFYFRKAKSIEQKAKTRQDLPIDKLARIVKKYEKIANLAKKKEDRTLDKLRKRREDYLINFSKLAETRDKWERIDEERRQEVLSRRASKEDKARRMLSAQMERRIGAVEQRKIKMMEVKRNQSNLRTEEVRICIKSI